MRNEPLRSSSPKEWQSVKNKVMAEVFREIKFPRFFKPTPSWIRNNGKPG